MENLFCKSLPEIEKIIADLGEPKFRAKQIREWLDKGVPNFSHIKNISAKLKQNLAKSFQTLPIEDRSVLNSSDCATSKFLFELSDGEKIETVLMRTNYGNSVCVSSQAGCAMGCKFCASTLCGLKRNLTADEMLAQVLRCQWELRKGAGTRANGDKKQNDVTHIVIMGTGEPLQNTDNVIGFMRRANNGLNIGWRRITLSTCGIVPEIARLKELDEPINLAISLHAPNDELRQKIMPIAVKYKIRDILDAAFDFSAIYNRQLMIEYILLGGFNDSEENAIELASILKNKLCMVNLISWNPVAECEWTASSGNQTHRFQDILIKNGIHSRIRKERGTDVGAACGQLRISK
ncbi:MAG: 23S rRNA (adenine(2503)-C(2))-methyltransferase RlmN [Rickettsiales bacterium]|jgi:23S rRNA (adenine2503-C2)-methyltransferase|nr:23S rRNA (adenine(2503)-C(2))-methyltransferase RlmN [Rickettsiales bacterium]